MIYILIAVFYLIVVILPVVFWLWFFLRQDRAEPEPRRLLIKALLLGIGVAILAIAVEGTIFSIVFPAQYGGVLEESSLGNGIALVSVILMFSLAGPIEECLKYLVLREAVYQKAAFNQIADGVIYGITLALGFVLVENTSYFLQLYLNLPTFLFIFTTSLRGVATTLLHVTCTGIIGLYLGRAKFTAGSRKWIILKGLIGVSLLHALFNAFLFSSGGLLLAFSVTVIAFIYLVRQLRKPATQMIWKLITPSKT